MIMTAMITFPMASQVTSCISASIAQITKQIEMVLDVITTETTDESKFITTTIIKCKNHLRPDIASI